MKNRLVYRYAAATVALALVLTLLLATQLALDWLVAWLVAINLVTFAAYWYDKRVSGSGGKAGRGRVPERVLLLLALLGGTPAAWLGMRLFRHKTIKQSFRQRFWLVVILQVALGIAYWATSGRV